MLDYGVGKIDALRPKILELLPHPGGGRRVFIAPENFISVAQSRRRIVHTAGKGIDPAVSMLDDAGLAVDKHVFRVARDDTHLHPPRGEKIVQAAIALTGEEKIEPILVRLPIGDERAGESLLTVARGLGDLHVERIEIAIADDLDLGHRVERFPDDFEQRRAEIARNPQIAFRAIKPLGKNGSERLTPRREALDRHTLHPVDAQRLGELMRGGAFLRPRALRLGGDIFRKRDQLLTAHPIVGGIFRVQGGDAELGIFFLKSLPDREENLPELRVGEAIALFIFACEHLALEIGGALEARGIGCGRSHQARIVAIGEAFREILEIGDLCGALGFHVEHADIEALGRRKIAPHVTRKVFGHEQIVCDAGGIIASNPRHVAPLKSV
jgi:hypothetical protein